MTTTKPSGASPAERPTGAQENEHVDRSGDSQLESELGTTRIEQAEIPFWERKTLAQMTAQEWESLCDGCGRCCLVKLEDEDTGAIHFTDVTCRLYDASNCRCSNYPHRSEVVTDCVTLDAEKIDTLNWLPPTCAYRLLADGEGLYWWHPLISGSPDSVHSAGVSVKGRVAASESEIAVDDLPDHVVKWPIKLSGRARHKR